MAESFASPVNAESIRDAIAQALRSGSLAVLITVIQSQHLTVGAKLFVTDTGQATGDLGDPDVNRAAIGASPAFLRSRAATRVTSLGEIATEVPVSADAQIMFERIEAEPQLVIAGAGHVGASLARLAALVGYRVSLIDDRPEFVAREKFATGSEQSIELITADSWSEAMGAACRQSSSCL